MQPILQVPQYQILYTDYQPLNIYMFIFKCNWELQNTWYTFHADMLLGCGTGYTAGELGLHRTR